MIKISQAIFIVVVVFGLMFITPYFMGEKEVDTIQESEWCEVGMKNEDGSVTYAGNKQVDELIAVATKNGPVLLTKCE